MRKALVFSGFTFMLLCAAIAFAQGPGMMGSGQGWNYCPNCGQYLGGGMMHGGYGMGPGMMHGAYGMGPGMMHGGYLQSEECQKFLDDTSSLRKDLNTRQYEYFEAARMPGATPESVAKIGEEIRDLQEKINAKAPKGCRGQ